MARREPPLEWVGIEGLAHAVTVVRVDERDAQTDIVTHVGDEPTTRQVGEALKENGILGVDDGCRQPTEDARKATSTAGKARHDTVVACLAEGHRCQRGAEFVADGDGVVVVTTGI